VSAAALALTRQNRAQIWPVFDALRAEFRQRGLWEPEEAKQAAADLLSKRRPSPLVHRSGGG